MKAAPKPGRGMVQRVFREDKENNEWYDPENKWYDPEDDREV